MGQGQSDGSSAAQSPFDSIPSNDRHGWKVMQVMANSPSSGLGIVPYFSVLTHINGVRCGRDESDLFPLIKENQAAQLTFLNLATLTNRTVTVTPRRGWGGDGLLGLMIRHDWFENAHLETIHVLDVHHGSPAEAAGLRAHVDYLLGTSRLAFKGYDSLDLFLTQYNGVDGRVVVFNKDSFSVREVMIKPSNSWGGAGSLGCDVACGFLHQLPLDGKRDVYFEAEGPGAASAGVAGIPQPVQTQSTQQQQFVPQQPQQAFPPQQQQQPPHFQGQQFQQQQVVFDPTQPHAPQQQFANPQAVYDPTHQQFAQQQFAHPQQQQQQQQQQFHQQQVAFDPTQLQQQHLSPQHVQQQAQQQAQHQVAFDPTQLAAAPAHQHQQHQQQHAAFPQDPAAPTPAAAPVEAQQQHAVSHEQHFHQQQQQSPPQQVPQQQHQQQFQQQQQHAQPASFEPAAAAPAAQPAAAAAPAAGAPQFSPEQMQQFLAWQAAQQQQQFGQVTVPQRGGLP